MSKPKIGLYWCSSCGGCEESVVDLAEHLLDVVREVDIVFWPVALDFKYKDVEALPDGSLAAVLINGAVRLSEQAEIARLLRRKSRVVIAHGACAHMGGVVGLGNLFSREELLAQAYEKAPSLARRGVPVEVPRFLDRTYALDQVIPVDYYLPGCPPAPETVLNALAALLSGNLPPRGAVLADSRALCDSCSRRDSKPERLDLTGFQRIHLTVAKPDRCFLEQGIVCLGPATRGGCGERCLKGNMPCTGCYGPTDNVLEQGAKFASTLGSMVNLTDPEAVKAWARSVPDPAGLLYRYSLAVSGLLGANPREPR